MKVENVNSYLGLLEAIPDSAVVWRFGDMATVYLPHNADAELVKAKLESLGVDADFQYGSDDGIILNTFNRFVVRVSEVKVIKDILLNIRLEEN